jgi:hypothetical protein
MSDISRSVNTIAEIHLAGGYPVWAFWIGLQLLGWMAV